MTRQNIVRYRFLREHFTFKIFFDWHSWTLAYSYVKARNYERHASGLPIIWGSFYVPDSRLRVALVIRIIGIGSFNYIKTRKQRTTFINNEKNTVMPTTGLNCWFRYSKNKIYQKPDCLNYREKPGVQNFFSTWSRSNVWSFEVFSLNPFWLGF